MLERGLPQEEPGRGRHIQHFHLQETVRHGGQGTSRRRRGVMAWAKSSVRSRHPPADKNGGRAYRHPRQTLQLALRLSSMTQLCTASHPVCQWHRPPPGDWWGGRGRAPLQRVLSALGGSLEKLLGLLTPGSCPSDHGERPGTAFEPLCGLLTSCCPLPALSCCGHTGRPWVPPRPPISGAWHSCSLQPGMLYPYPPLFTHSTPKHPSGLNTSVPPSRKPS